MEDVEYLSWNIAVNVSGVTWHHYNYYKQRFQNSHDDQQPSKEKMNDEEEDQVTTQKGYCYFANLKLVISLPSPLSKHEWFIV